jgi:ceramide glucosyltransferase
VGQLFTNPLPVALLMVAMQPSWWALLPLTMILRALAAWAVAVTVLRDPLTARRWWLVPLQDLLSFVMWIAGFFGNTIVWRGRTYFLKPDGRFELRG